jgi:hypothetical protein
MKKRILCLGLLAVVSQFLTTGCLYHHPVARWRANHPYGVIGACGPCALGGPARPIMYKYAVGDLPGGPVIDSAPCHGCGGGPGVPVSFGGGPGTVVPVTNTPTIGYPMPLSPGPMVVPSTELHAPMPMPKSGTP